MIRRIEFRPMFPGPVLDYVKTAWPKEWEEGIETRLGRLVKMAGVVDHQIKTIIEFALGGLKQGSGVSLIHTPESLKPIAKVVRCDILIKIGAVLALVEVNADDLLSPERFEPKRQTPTVKHPNLKDVIGAKVGP